MKKIIYICLSLSTLALTGCSGIEQPIASRELVEDNFETNSEDMPEELWNSFATLLDGDQVLVNSKQLVLGSRFFSASGRNCRELRDDSASIRVACKDKNSAKWYLIKSVLSSYSEQLNEAGETL